MLATHYPTEDELQRYLADYVDLIPGDQINPESPRRWLLVGREVGVPGAEGETGRWSLDHLFLDQDGIPTFVECKRAVDTRARREVVAQMLDYAANGLAYWSIDRIRLAAAETAARRGQDLTAQLLELVNGSSDDDIDAFWEQVETHMREQQVRLIFVVDEAPRELRQLVEFLNQKLRDVDVMIVEVKQYQGEGMTALAPRLLGMTETARAQKTTTSARKPKLTAQQYLDNLSPAQQEVARYIWQEAESRHYIISWAAISFAVRMPDPRTQDRVAFLYGYGSHYDFYFDGVPFSSQAQEAWRQVLLATGVFRSSGKHMLQGVEITASNSTEFIQVLHRVFERMDALVAELMTV